MLEAGFERLSKKEQVIMLHKWGIKVKEIAIIMGYGVKWIYRIVRREPGGTNKGDEK